jgi:hypothetical protein
MASAIGIGSYLTGFGTAAGTGGGGICPALIVDNPRSRANNKNNFFL